MPSTRKLVWFRLPPEQHEALKALAEKQHRTLGGQVEYIVSLHLIRHRLGQKRKEGR